MKHIIVATLIVSCSITLISCGAGSQATPLSEQAMKATVAAAVQATADTQKNNQATIDAAVKATGQAMAAATTPTLPPASTTMPPAAATGASTPAPVPPEQYATMSEEELAAYIDQAVAAAVAETLAASTSISTAATDDAVSQAEYDALVAAVNEATAAIVAAESAVTAYSDLYGELAAETLATLQAIEQDLQTMNTTLMAIDETLIVISASLQQGVALAADTINQLEAAALQTKAAADATQAKAQTWLTTVQANLDRRASDVQAAKPTNVANTAAGALQSANQYLESVRSALADKKVSPDELARISVDSANAVASLMSVGGAELQGVADSIAAMTNQLARGQLPQLQMSLNEFNLPSLPSIPKPSR
jgi:trimeric autotransporter adhesin